MNILRRAFIATAVCLGLAVPVPATQFLLVGVGSSGGPPTDPFYSSVVLLGTYQGTNGATSYNELKNGAAATFNGTSQISTAQAAFGTSSLLCQGDGNYISFADSANWIFPGEFTLETWWRAPSITAISAALLAHRGDNGAVSWQISVVESAGAETFEFGFSTDGSGFAHQITSSDVNFVANTWYFGAVDRDAAGKMRLYFGTTGTAPMVGSKNAATGTNFNSTVPLTICQNSRSVSVKQPLTGNIGATRITKGAARYASDAGALIPISLPAE